MDCAKMAQCISTFCVSCKESTATLYCYQCEKRLCQTCRILHDQFQQRHSVTDIHKVDMLIKRKCEVHKGDFIYFCTICECLICIDCVTTEHNGHKLKSLADVAENFRGNVKQMKTMVDRKLEHISKEINKVEKKYFTDVQKESDKYVEEVQTLRKKIKHSISSLFKRQKTIAKEFCKSEIKILNEHLKELKRIKETFETSNSKLSEFLLDQNTAILIDHLSSLTIEVDSLEEIPITDIPKKLQEFDSDAFLEQIVNQIVPEYQKRIQEEINRQNKIVNKYEEQCRRLTEKNNILQERLTQLERDYCEIVEEKEALKIRYEKTLDQYQEDKKQFTKTLTENPDIEREDTAKIKEFQYIIKTIWQIRKLLNRTISDREPDVEFSAVTKYREHLKVLLDIKHNLESKSLTTKDKKISVMCNAPKNITEQADNQPEDIHALTRKEETNPMEENLTARCRKLKEKNGNLLEVSLESLEIKTQYAELLKTVEALKKEKDQLSKKSFICTPKYNIPNKQILKRFKLTSGKSGALFTLVLRIIKCEQAYNQVLTEKEDLNTSIDRPITAPVNYVREYKEMQQRFETVKAEKESLMQRLSMVAGLMMKDNNPTIAGLSNHNPVKLAEQFREIYDNDWPDVLDHITDKAKVSDEIAVKQIVDALQTMFDKCRWLIKRNTEEIIKIIGYPEDSLEKQYTGGKDGHDPVLKIIKNLVQGSAERIRDDVVKMIKNEHRIKDFTETGGKSADNFITKCSCLCLFMCVQDPPLFFDFDCKKGAPFNKEKFNPFTSIGDIVDFLVWPVMYLSENGVAMSKGIAQGKKKT